MRYSVQDLKLMKRLVVGAEVSGVKGQGIGTVGDDLQKWQDLMTCPDACLGCRGIPMRPDAPPPYPRAVLRSGPFVCFTTVCCRDHARTLRDALPTTVLVEYVDEEEWHRLMACHEVLSE